MIIILVDLRMNNGHVLALLDEDGNIAQFDTLKSARDCRRNHPLNMYPWLFVDMDSCEVIDDH